MIPRKQLLLLFISHILVLILGSLVGLLFMLTFPFISIYRIIVIICAKIVRRDLVSIICGFDPIFVGNISVKDNKQELAVIFTFTLNSVVTYEKVYTFFNGLLAQEKYHRWCEFAVSWMGFLFWKRETPFSLEKHIFVVDKKNGEVQNEKWLTDFTKKLLIKPFVTMQSPWEVYILPNYQPMKESENTSAIMIRYHHALADGHSFLKIFATAFDNYMPIKYENPNSGKIFYKIRPFFTWVLIPYHLVKILFDAALNNRVWKKFSGEITTAQVNISMERILLLRRKYIVGFYPILLSAITTTIRNILIQKNSKIPEKVHIMFPFPIENHPEFISNHFVMTPFPLPVAISDPVERLMRIDTDFEKLTSSQVAELLEMTYRIGGLMPHAICKRISKIPATAVVTIFPIGDQKEFFGCPISSYKCSMDVPEPHTGAGMFIYGGIHNGDVNICAVYATDILASDELAAEVMEDINQYVDSLLQN